MNRQCAFRVMSALAALMLSGCANATPVTPTRAVVVPPSATSFAPGVKQSQVVPTATSIALQPLRPAHTLDLGNGLWLATTQNKSQDNVGNYSIDLQMPYVGGSTTSQAERFNDTVRMLIIRELETFKNIFKDHPIPDPGGFIQVAYQVTNASNGLLSILFEFESFTGGAHTSISHSALNFDLRTGQALSLSDLFKPGVDYLSELAIYCTDELRTTNRLNFPQGAEPTAEHYQVWNFDLNHVLITFETYQVTPGVAGPQVVAIPYSRLSNLLSPDNPLADFVGLTERR